MRTTLLVVLLLLLGMLVAGGMAATLTVVVKYPLAKNVGTDTGVFLRGEGGNLSWSKGVEMTASGEDTWSVAVQVKDSSSQLLVKVLLNDTVWQRGENVRVQQGDATVYPWFFLTQGSISVYQGAYAPTLNDTRDVSVYMPPSFGENGYKSYPTLVMHDGNNLYNGIKCSSCCPLGCWGIQPTLDGLMLNGDMQEVVVIGPYNDANRTSEYTYSYDSSVGAGGDADKYLDFVFDTLLPELKGQLRAKTDPSNVGSIGSSLGGLLSCYAGWTRPHQVTRVGCMSSSFWWNNEDFLNTVMPAHATPAIRVYLDSGNAGPDNDDEAQTIRVRNQMETLGFQLGKNLAYFLDNGGMHNEHYWGDRVWRAFSFLYPGNKP